MVHLSRAQEETRHQIKQLAGSGLLPAELSRRLLSVLLLTMPADQVALFGIDPDSFLINRLLASVGSGVNDTYYWLQHVYLAREPVAVVTFPSLMAANVRAVTMGGTPEACWGLPATTLDQFAPRGFYRAYHDIGSPPGGGVRIWFEADGRKIAALQAARLEPTNPFRPSDAQFLLLLAPAIGRALSMAFRREEALANLESELPATGMLVISSGGSIALQTPAVDTWFKLLVDSHCGSIADSGVPVVVWSVIAALKTRGGLDDGAAFSALRVPTRHGTLRVEASPAGEDGTVAVVLLPERSRTPPQLPLSWQLTPQETRILSLITQGLSNRQIAETLVVSENTIEKHLAHAYEKIAVSSRTQFLARLFQETYWPVRFP